MNLAFSPEPETNRIFVLSALGSVLLHGILLALLALSPQSPPIEKDPPRVQVQLVQKIEAQPAPQPPSPPQLAQVKPWLPPPIPPARPRESKPIPPTPQMAQRPQTPMAPPKSMELKKPILQDTQATRALQARDMMKMASPAQPSLSLPTQQQAIAPSVAPPPMATLERSQSLPPAPRPLTTTRPKALQASPPVSTGERTTSPVILASSKPLYPRVAREAGWEGTVIVRTLINHEGVPTQTEIRKSSGHPPLDQSAMEAIKTWTFRPAQDGNIPIAKWVDIPVKFDLNR
ncbi:MAG: TonB family protein [Nitrospirales bacterium]|nr:TonB family protein [Nitrospirales bacterium]